MPRKLDEYRQQILDLKAEGVPVREIASKLTKIAGSRVAPSTVHHAVKQWSNCNGEKDKTDSSIDSSVLEGRIHSLEVLVDELKTHVKGIECLVWEDWGNGARVLRDRESGRGLMLRGKIPPMPWWEKPFNWVQRKFPSQKSGLVAVIKDGKRMFRTE